MLSYVIYEWCQYLTAPWWTNQPNSIFLKNVPSMLRPFFFSFGCSKLIKKKKIGSFRNFKRVTVHQSRMYEKTNILAICGQNWMGPWNLEQKWGWKVIFILWHFLIRGQITDLVACWLFWPYLAISAIFGQNWMGPWNLEQKWGWKVIFYDIFWSEAK